MQTAAAYRKNIGLLDADGNRHKVGAYLAIDPGNLDQLLVAMYCFTTIGIGINFPGSAMDQFNAGQPWTPVAGATVDGGHYICGFARRNGMWVLVTWGKEQPASDDFLRQYNDENVVYLSQEMLTGGKTLDGFDVEQLNADLAAL